VADKAQRGAKNKFVVSSDNFLSEPLANSCPYRMIFAVPVLLIEDAGQPTQPSPFIAPSRIVVP
jgi:hypothetical protein